jgi:hypothetical protein
MIDFTKAEYDDVCLMMDSLRLMCAQRHTCRECPMNVREQKHCAVTLLDTNIMDFEYRHKLKESGK